jgi:hypothetical protein
LDATALDRLAAGRQERASRRASAHLDPTFVSPAANPMTSASPASMPPPGRARGRAVGLLGALLVVTFGAGVAAAQSRPLVTQDPEPVASGKMLIDVGTDYSRGDTYPLSGLTGSLYHVGGFDLSFGISPVAEIQLSGGFHDVLHIDSRNGLAPLAGRVTATGDWTADNVDGVLGAKVRLYHETASHPSLAIRFTTRLPNAKHDSGLGLDTTDFAFGFLSGKTINGWRVVGNLGFAILQDPLNDGIQNDVITYGASVVHGLKPGVEVVADLNGRADSRHGVVPLSTEPRSMLRLGGRITRGDLRYDAGFFLGLTSHDPTWGITGGLTWTFDAFDIK